MPTWNNVIPYIIPGEQVAAGVVNRPLGVLAQRTDYLKAIYESITTNEFTYVANVAVSPDTAAGMLVYWDPVALCYSPALAAWSDTLDQWGALIPADSAVVAGVLATKHTDYTGSIIIGGFIHAFASLTALFGTATPTVGKYYLSSSVPGQTTLTPPAMAQLVLVYEGGGDVLLPSVRFEKSTHDHRTYQLKSTMWLSANTTNFPNFDIPATALWGYNRFAAGEEEISAIFTLYPGEGFLMYNVTGSNIPPAEYILDQDDIWLTVAPPANALDFYLTSPNAHGPGIVRAIQTTTPDELTVTLVNGLATIDKKTLPVTTGVAGFNVVKNITSTSIEMGQVVEKVVSGPGIYISNYSGAEGQGVVEISQLEFSGRPIDASLINLNNAMEITTDGIIYTAFPKARNSSMTAVVPGSVWGSSTKLAGVWLWVRGSTGMPTVTVSVSVMAFGPPGAGAVIHEPVTHTISITGATDPNMYYAFETLTADRFQLVSGSLAQYTIAVNNTYGVDVLVMRQGIQVYNP